MENFIYKISPSKLEGEVTISGAKNSVLRLLAASLLTKEKVTLLNSPNNILDVILHIDMLRALGKKVNVIESTLVIEENNFDISDHLIWTKRSIRNTVLIAGSLLARLGSARVPLPGGCDLGDRKIDLHLMIFEKFGAKYRFEKDDLVLTSENRLQGCDIYLPIRSTGATENALICATLANGTTRIYNPHVRPEILDLIKFLKSIGARIYISGQDYIEIIGTENSEKSIHHEVIPDNVEALTWMMLAIMHKSYFKIHKFPYNHLIVPIQFLREGNSIFSMKDDTLIIKGEGATSYEIATGPFPGINSDLQPVFAAYAMFTEGTSVIHDLRFHNRFQYIDELRKLNGTISRKGTTVKIAAHNNYKNSRVKATDLRGGVCVAMCGSLMKGEMIIDEAFHIERGYNNFVSKFKSLGGVITKEFI